MLFFPENQTRAQRNVWQRFPWWNTLDEHADTAVSQLWALHVREAMRLQKLTFQHLKNWGKRLLHTPSQVTIVSHFTLPPSPILPAILQNPTSEDMKVQNNRTVKIAAGMALCIHSSGSRVFRFPSLCPSQQPHVRDSYAARCFCKHQAATFRLSLPFIHPDTLEIKCRVGKLRS